MTTETCAHRWRIESPSGSPTSPGTCVYCGLTKQHRNSTDDSLYGLDTMANGWAFQRRAELRAAGMRGPVRS